MAIRNLQTRPAATVPSAESAESAGSSGSVASDLIQDADQGAVNQLFTFASSDTGTGGEAQVDEQNADLSAMQTLAGATSSEPALSGNGFTYRHNWGSRRGQHKLRLNLAGVTTRSRVFVSIGEGSVGGPDAGKFIGDARFTLYNVAPRAGSVDVWVNIDWKSNIPIYIDYLIITP